MQEQRASLSVVLMGGSGTGKSTLAGHLAVKAGAVPAREAEKMEKECVAAGAGREKRFAWLLDRSQQERAWGATLMLSRVAVETARRVMTVFVVPGASRSVRVACRAISQADVAVLVVDPNPIELDESLGKNGRATEHLLLAHTYGIKDLVVVVNKMDSSHARNGSARFEDVKADIEKAAKKARFDLKRVVIVPASGLLGDNLTEKPTESMQWYKGPTLLQVLSDVAIPARHTDLPLRLVVRDVYRPSVSAGRVEQGTIRVGQVVTMAPRMITTVVESLQMRGRSVESASAGDVVGVVLKDVDFCELDRAAVVGDNIDPPRVCAQFVARIQVSNHLSEIRPHYCPQILFHAGAVPCAFVRLVSKKKKEETIESPESIANQETAQVLIVPLRPVVLETFDEKTVFGRFAVRDASRIVAVGMVTICTPDEKTKRRVIREHVRKQQKEKK